MKRLLRLAGFTVLAMGMTTLVGCGPKNEDVAAAGPHDSGIRVKIGVSVPAADHGWTAGVGWWAERAKAMYPNVEWVYQTAGTPGKQISDIEDMMAQKVQALVILATESGPLTDVAERAHERGIYIVNVDRGFTKQGIADVFLEGDNEAFGRKSAEYMAKKLGKGKKIVILRGIPCTVDTARFEAAMKVFNQEGIEVLGSLPGMWNQEKSLACMQTFLSQYKHIDAVWASDDDMALGCEKAIREAGRADEMWILGGAGMKDIIKKVMDKDPMYPADITYPPSMIATGIHLAVASMRDGNQKAVSEFMPKHIVMDVEMVTPENAKNYYFPKSVY
ncbi:MAG: ABC transporter substrate-binding protein [Victivallales bacterium]|nr:ABC transporter substrate-binding protein [Victivallales bacterium]